MPTAVTDAAGFDARKTRRYLLQRGFKPEKIVPCCYRPFDDRWLYWEPETSLLDRRREEYFPHIFDRNIWLAAVQQNRKNFDPPVVTRKLCSLHVIERGANLFPAFLHLGTHDTGQPNVSRSSSKYLTDLASGSTDVEILFNHVVATLYSPSYSSTNATALRQGWPRIPLPTSKAALVQSAEIGHEIAVLLDVDTAIASVTRGKIRPELAVIAVASREGGGSLNPDAGDLDVTAGWGHSGNGGAVMPGKGKIVERDYTTEERRRVAEGAAALGLSDEQTLNLLGARTLDVYLNNIAYWKNIPARLWEYTIGGYQVIKKWLSYREREILERGLTTDEVHAVTEIARRIAAILLLEPKFDANYEAVTRSTFRWPSSEGVSQNRRSAR